MLTRDDIEGFLDRLSAEGESYEEIEQGLWIIRPGGNLELDVVVHFSPPVVLLRVKVMNVPSDDGKCADLNRRAHRHIAGARLELVPHATHRYDDTRAITFVAWRTVEWFSTLFA